ncbi:MAG: flagellar basal-body MS-ring/collar protein FliF [Hyphomonas sp.]|nr:flagellar basal-body MS-ring/collar protein FliF [Hyphomonas sp.]
MAVAPPGMPPQPPLQWQRFALVFGGVAGVLLAGYFFVLRAGYDVLFDDMTAAEAALVVSELEAMDVAYRVADGGRRVEVSARKADEVRLKIAGTTSAASRLVGFELFNETDMGMTEFAQKIKYQRAIQGELARSILLIEGIEDARVQLAIPERATFRADQAAATASVTLVTRRGAGLSPDRINAVRHLVAASVPALSPDAVTILDQNRAMIAGTAFTSVPGRQDSAAREDPGPPGEAYYTERLQAVISQMLPGANSEIVLSLSQGALAHPAEGADGDPDAARPAPAASGTAGIVLITDYPLSRDIQDGIAAAAQSLMPAPQGSGQIPARPVFLVRQAALARAAPAIAETDGRAAAVSRAAGRDILMPRLNMSPGTIALGVLVGAGALIAGGALWRLRRRRHALSAEDRRAFADLLHKQIALQSGELT